MQRTETLSHVVQAANPKGRPVTSKAVNDQKAEDVYMSVGEVAMVSVSAASGHLAETIQKAAGNAPLEVLETDETDKSLPLWDSQGNTDDA